MRYFGDNLYVKYSIPKGMIKRGKEIAKLSRNPDYPRGKPVKGYSWICVTCSKEFISLEDCAIHYNRKHKEKGVDVK